MNQHSLLLRFESSLLGTISAEYSQTSSGLYWICSADFVRVWSECLGILDKRHVTSEATVRFLLMRRICLDSAGRMSVPLDD